MRKIIVVTGTAGTGKTSLCSYVVRKNRGWVHLDLGKFAIDSNAVIGYDSIMKTRIVDTSVLKKALRKYILSKLGEDLNLLIDGHYAAEVSPAEYVDCCIVLRCRPDVLWHRLRKIKGYNEEKARENVESELTDYCYLNAKKYLKKVRIIQLDTTRKSIKNLYYRFMKCYKNDFKCKSDEVDWISYFSKHSEKLNLIFR
ncbi:MAG: adenylate kinase family protein [Candidatus Brockarchaeota archaeon]|nr:adenylate kinase family protein [Candidatus Brockarchaeota archaeon]